MEDRTMTRTRRRPYRGARRFDRTCRNRGDDPRSRGNRLHNARRRNDAARREIAAWQAGQL